MLEALEDVMGEGEGGARHTLPFDRQVHLDELQAQGNSKLCQEELGAADQKQSKT